LNLHEKNKKKKSVKKGGGERHLLRDRKKGGSPGFHLNSRKNVKGGQKKGKSPFRKPKEPKGEREFVNTGHGFIGGKKKQSPEEGGEGGKKKPKNQPAAKKNGQRNVGFFAQKFLGGVGVPKRRRGRRSKKRKKAI